MMLRYEDVLNKASELYAVMDALIAQYYSMHYEDNALTVTHTKLAIQKHLSVPPLVMRPDPVKPLAPPIVVEPVVPLPAPEPSPVEDVVEPEPAPDEPPDEAPVKRSHKRKA